MKKIKIHIPSIFKIATFSLLAFTTSQANAAIQFRVGFDVADNRYAIYMTPDSPPSHDMLLSAQVTLVVPHDTDTPFSVEDIRSQVSGVNWATHSRVNAPHENQKSDYISLGYSFTEATPPMFNWIAGQEKKIFSFKSIHGCDSRVKLIDNSDNFSQLPNSANTNPGNDFLNIGWVMSNAYTGNYGDPINCSSSAGGTTQLPQTPQTPQTCEYTKQDKFYIGRIERMEALRESAPVYLHKRFDAAINNLKSKLSCQK